MTYMEVIEWFEPHPFGPGFAIVMLYWARDEYDEDWLAEMQ